MQEALLYVVKMERILKIGAVKIVQPQLKIFSI